MKNITFNFQVPDGYEIDPEKSTLANIVLKPVTPIWRYNEKARLDGYWIDEESAINGGTGYTNMDINRNVFATKKQAESALTMAQISQIMDNDPRFGGPITDDEWNSSSEKFIISRFHTSISTDIIRCGDYEFLAFHTLEQRELFLKENEDLVKEYLMID